MSLLYSESKRVLALMALMLIMPLIEGGVNQTNVLNDLNPNRPELTKVSLRALFSSLRSPRVFVQAEAPEKSQCSFFLSSSTFWFDALEIDLQLSSQPSTLLRACLAGRSGRQVVDMVCGRAASYALILRRDQRDLSFDVAHCLQLQHSVSTCFCRLIVFVQLVNNTFIQARFMILQ